VNAIVRRAVRSALEGKLGAAKFVLDRVCGKARDAPAEAAPLDLDLPTLRIAGACAAAIDRIAAAVTAGTVETTAAKLLLKVVQARLEAIEVQDLESRLTELECVAKERGSQGPAQLTSSAPLTRGPGSSGSGL